MISVCGACSTITVAVGTPYIGTAPYIGTGSGSSQLVVKKAENNNPIMNLS